MKFRSSFPPTGLAKSEPEDKLRRESIHPPARRPEMDSRLRGNDDSGKISAKTEVASLMADAHENYSHHHFYLLNYLFIC
jgi:hypothetical protein